MEGEPQNIVAFHTMVSILTKIQTWLLNFELDIYVESLPWKRRDELKMLDSLATIAVMDRDVIAIVAAKHDDLENISKTGWNPSIKAVVAAGNSHVEDNQAAPQHSSMKKPSNQIFNLSPLLKDKDAKGSTPQQGLGMKKGPFKRFMVSMNTCYKSVGRPIPQNGILVICDVQASKAF